MNHLSQVVNRIAAKKSVHLGSVSTGEVRSIERMLENGSIDIDQAISNLEKIDKIRLSFERADYNEIRKDMR